MSRYQVTWDGYETVLSDAVCHDSIPDQTLVAVHIEQSRAERNLKTQHRQLNHTHCLTGHTDTFQGSEVVIRPLPFHQLLQQYFLQGVAPR